MTLLLLLLIALAVLAALLWAARPGPQGRMLLMAALLTAGAGYVWQGRPTLAGSPTAPRANHPAADPLFASEWKRWLGGVGPEADLLSSADMLIAGGAPDYAIGILRGGIARSPRSMALWIGLGNALATYADGSLTPAARFAYLRAAALAPDHPAPGYFLGLAYASEGDFAGAERQWRAVLTRLPATSPFRALIETRLALLARLRAMAGAGQLATGST